MNESMRPADLLRAAARLIERAHDHIDVRAAPCPHCDVQLFENVTQARIRERLTETPGKLRAMARELDDSVLPSGQPRTQSRGYADAAAARLIGDKTT